MLFRKTRLQSQLLIAIFIIQAFASALLLSSTESKQLFWGTHNINTWLSALITLCLILAIGQLYRLLRTANLETELELSNIQLKENKAQLESLLAERHDFLNHLQTINGFLQLNRPDMVQNYTQEVIRDLTNQQTSKQTSQLEINALLIKMTDYGRERGVTLKYTLTGKDSPVLPIPPASATRLVGNLLRNAIEAVQGLSPEARWVKLTLGHEHSHCRIEVENPGPHINAANLEKIFEKGFSTKAKSGRGLGLDIVRKLTEEQGGTVQVDSSPQTGTKFTITFPM
ncbi:MAG TPA: ATP-binding protein [Bacillota bacterium]|nr:ATP-binding protein [Bacillota bacterium]